MKETNKNIGAVYCGTDESSAINNNLHSHKTGNLTTEIMLHAFITPYLHISTITYKREAILNINCFDESYQHYQDSEFYLRYFERYSIENIQENLIQLDSNSSVLNVHTEDLTINESKRKFLHQFSYISQSIIKSQYESLNKKNACIQKMEQLKASINELLKIRFSRHPIKKIKSYKKLMNIYKKSK